MAEAEAQTDARESLWSALGTALGAQMGLHFPPARRADLKRGIAAAARSFGMRDAEACARWLLSRALTREQIEVLADCLTVGETYFFRDRKSFEVLETRILPGLLKERAAERRLRIWSAGCCTGEEPYSIAILLATMVPDLRDWNISILATDIDPGFLRKACAGSYGEWSFRDAPAGLKERFFSKTAERRYEIAHRIKSLVSFEYLNLAQEGYPSVESATNAMDLILCRNVLMYFEPRLARTVLGRLGRSLVEGGWLLVSPAEIPQASLAPLVAVNFSEVIAHRKQTASEALARSTPPKRDAFAPPAPAASRPAPVRPAAPAPQRQGRKPEPPVKAPADAPESRHDAPAMALRARSCANQGLLDQASAWCEKALAAERMNPAWHYLHGIVLQELGRTGEAAAAFRRTLYLDADHALAHFSLGGLSRREGRPAEARRHYRNALAVLNGLPQAQVLPESEGMTAGRLAEMIRTVVPGEARA